MSWMNEQTEYAVWRTFIKMEISLRQLAYYYHWIICTLRIIVPPPMAFWWKESCPDTLSLPVMCSVRDFGILEIKGDKHHTSALKLMRMLCSSYKLWANYLLGCGSVIDVIYPYISGLPHWHLDNHIDGLVQKLQCISNWVMSFLH